jgi:hypothetical protein
MLLLDRSELIRIFVSLSGWRIGTNGLFISSAMGERQMLAWQTKGTPPPAIAILRSHICPYFDAV